MKKLMLVLSFLLIILSSLRSEEKFRYENTSWGVIEEGLTDGKILRPFVYDEFVNIALEGAKEKDSMLVIPIIKHLNSITETVTIRLNKDNSNFFIKFRTEAALGGSTTSQSTGSTNLGPIGSDVSLDKQINSIEKSIVALYIDNYQKEEKISDLLYYYIIKSLTKQLNYRKWGTYNGVFEGKENEIKIHEVDFDVIRKIYSKSFLDDFKEYQTKKKNKVGKGLILTGSRMYILYIIIGILLPLLLFTILLSRNSLLKNGASISDYLKDGAILITGIALITSFFTFIQLESISPEYLIQRIIIPVIVLYLFAVITIVILYKLEKSINSKNRSFIKRLSISFFISIISILFAYLVFTFVGLMISKPKILWFSAASIKNIQSLYITFSFATIRSIFLFFQHKTQSLINQKDVELAKMTTLKNQAELSALHARINPHFLYNSLNSIAGLAETEPKKVQKMSMALSDLFRYAVNKENDSMVRISQEIEMVKRYLEIEQTRFGDHLDYSVEIEEGVDQIQIPKFLIQPLVENAIKHGVSNITKNGIVKIELLRKNKDLIISVFDNGPDFPEDLVSGYGLQNLHDKLEIIYKNKASISWMNGSDKHISITLKNQFNDAE